MRGSRNCNVPRSAARKAAQDDMKAIAYANAFDASHGSAEPRVRLDELERAIYSTIAYRDVFDFAVTVDEIHRYLHWVRCERSDVSRALAQQPLASCVAGDGRFYALRERSHLLQVRPERQRLTERFQSVARRYARYLASLPHVRMVGITGSLAAGNVRADCDIDFMVLTEAGTMWRTRALAMVSALINRKFGSGRLCPNFFLSVAALTLERRSLYDAHELAQLIPVYGRESYAELREANRWAETFLPNATGAPTEQLYFDRPSFAVLRACAEWGSRSVLGRLLENFEAGRKIHRFNDTDRLKGAWTKSTRESHSLRDHVRQDIETAWRRRLDELQ
jgi:hypothetical protein